jgi:hypothetical protein
MARNAFEVEAGHTADPKSWLPDYGYRLRTKRLPAFLSHSVLLYVPHHRAGTANAIRMPFSWSSQLMESPTTLGGHSASQASGSSFLSPAPPSANILDVAKRGMYSRTRVVGRAEPGRRLIFSPIRLRLGDFNARSSWGDGRAAVRYGSPPFVPVLLSCCGGRGSDHCSPEC